MNAVTNRAGSEPVFDYSSLPKPLAKQLRARAERVHCYGRQTVSIMGHVGEELLAARAELEHGQFLAWVEGALGMSKSAAYRAMECAENLGGVLPTLGSLPITIVQAIGAKATPEPVRLGIVQRIADGEPADPTAIKREIEEARAKAKSDIKAAKLSPEQRKKLALREKRRDQRDARERAKWQAEAAARQTARDAALDAMADLLVAKLERADLDTLVDQLTTAGAGTIANALRERVVS